MTPPAARSRRLPAMVLPLVLLLAAACGGSDVEPATQTPTATPTAVQTTVSTLDAIPTTSTVGPAPGVTESPVAATVPPTATVEPTATATVPATATATATVPPAPIITVGCRLEPRRSVFVGEVLTFTALSNPPDTQVSFVFDHGDGTLDPGPVSQAFYAAPGTYDVELRWSHGGGSGTTFCGSIVVMTTQMAQLSISALAGPTCPVETFPPRPECAPRSVDAAVMIINDAAGNELVRGTTRPDGLLLIDVPAGTLTVVPQPVLGLLGTAAPVTVSVSAGETVSVVADYDTGIR